MKFAFAVAALAFVASMAPGFGQSRPPVTPGAISAAEEINAEGTWVMNKDGPAALKLRVGADGTITGTGSFTGAWSACPDTLNVKGVKRGNYYELSIPDARECGRMTLQLTRNGSALDGAFIVSAFGIGYVRMTVR